jgi:serine phosphatase RsbU (regulator of sigma subunit)
MHQSEEKTEIAKWIGIILDPNPDFVTSLNSGWKTYRKKLVSDVAEAVYEGLRDQKSSISAPFSIERPFGKLSVKEKRFWFSFATSVPGKLKSLNLCIRPFSDFCRTCIITENEIERLAASDYSSLVNNDPEALPFTRLPERKKRFYIEMNHLIPLQLKKAGFEIIRAEEIAEIDEKMVKKIARAIHSRYQHQIRKQHKGKNTAGEEVHEFDTLQADIIFSNIDNAWHIPTKLLSIGYRIRKVKKGHKPFALRINDMEIETMAAVEHLRWSWDKRLHGWTWGKTKNKKNKRHPGLIPYYLLPEIEKEKDRELVRLIPALLQDIDYEASPVNPNRIRKLSYAIKPQSSIQRILDETREINEQIKGMVKLSPEVEEMVAKRNKKIGEAIHEIEGSYNYAHHIQETFLPDDLFVRECFPESFILFKPRDIISGDFYFFSKHDDLVIFAAADCTGHGIPGALLTTIGYGTLDQAVNEIKLTRPAEILEHLYSRIHRFLRRSDECNGLGDDMDLVLCALNIRKNTLTYSSVNSPFFHLTNGNISEVRPNNVRGGCQSAHEGECKFESSTLQLATGDTLYLFSDGFADQFGGKNHKKYQKNRFMDFLLNISGLPMPEQSDMLFEEIEQWREASKDDQTDDIMVMGIRV